MKKSLLFLLLFVASFFNAKSAHLIGGELYYECLGDDLYKVVLILYRDCNSNGATLDEGAYMGLFQDNGNTIKLFEAPLISKTQIPATISNPCFEAPEDLCIERGYYEDFINISPSSEVRHLSFRRCCWSDNITNLIDNEGVTLTVQIPPTNIAPCNNSARSKIDPPSAICVGEDIFIDASGIDFDGDQLAYALCAPYDGAGPGDPRPNATAPPYFPVTFETGYSGAYPIDASPAMSIDPVTGQITGKATTQGEYVLTVCISEFRDGVLINTNYRAFRFKVILCESIVNSNFSYIQKCFGEIEFVNEINEDTVKGYKWNFGDPSSGSNTSSLRNPTHNFSSPGTYFVELVGIAKPPCGIDDSITKVVIALDSLRADFNIPDSACFLNNKFNFVGQSTYSSGVNYNWTFGPNANKPTAVGRIQNNVVFSKPGWQTIKLQATKGECSEFVEKSIYLSPPIQAEIIGDSVQCILNNVFDFSVIGSFGSNAKFNWSFGPNGSPSSSNIKSPNSISFNAIGVYTIFVNISDSSCSKTISKDITINDEPIASFETILDTQCLKSNSFDFTNTSTYGSSAIMTWNFNNATPSTSGDISPTVSFNATGWHTVNLNITDGDCSSEYTDSIFITPTPLVYFDTPSNQCLIGNTFDFNGIVTTGNDATLLWDFGFGATPATANTLNVTGVVYNISGFKTISLKVLEHGCDTTYSITEQIVFDTPEPFFTRPDTSCLSANSIRFVNSGTYSPNANHVWNFGPNASPSSSTSENPSGIQFDKEGWHSITVLTTDLDCDSTYIDSIFIAPDPKAYFAIPEKQCILGNSFDFNYSGSIHGTVDSVLWDFGNLATPRYSSLDFPIGISFNDTGYIPVSFTLYSYDCAITYSDLVYVQPAPEPFFEIPEKQCITNNNFDLFALGTYTNQASFLWDFGLTNTPSSSIDKNPTNIHFNSTGSNPVSLSITEYGCTVTYTSNVYTSNIPTPFFNPLDTQALSGNNYTIYNNGTYDTNATFYWDFDTNSNFGSSTLENIQNLSYTDVGWYVVTLTISDNGCDSTYLDSLFIIVDPTAKFPQPSPQCQSDNSFSFTTTGSSYYPGATFYWDFGPFATPTSSTLQNPTGVSFPSIGNHPVSLTITDHGSSNTFESFVTTHPSPTAFFTPPAIQCVKTGSFDFYGEGTYTDSAKFLWDFGFLGAPNTSTDLNTKGVVFLAPGANIISFTISQLGCNITYSDTVFVNPEPQAKFEIPDSQCVDNNIFNFINQSSYRDGASFLWTFANDANINSSSDFEPTNISYASPGWKSVRLEVKDLGCTDVFTELIRVTAPPAPTFATLNDTCIDNHSIDFLAAGSFSNNAEFLWDFGPDANITNSVMQNPAGIEFNSLGVHQITLTVSDNGCARSYSDNITLTPSPIAIADSTLEQCVINNNYSFNGSQSSYGSNAEILWDFGNLASSQFGNNIIENNISFNTADTHLVHLIIEENGCLDTFKLPVKVTPDPDPTFTKQNGQCFEINKFNFTSEKRYGDDATFFWNFGADAVPPNATIEEPGNVVFMNSGWHNVTLEVQENGCANTYSDSIHITLHPICYLDPPATQCLGNNSFDFAPSANSRYGNDANFAWDFGPGASPRISILENPRGIEFNVAQTHTITLTIEENGCDSTNTTKVIISPTPSAYFPHEDPQCISNNQFQFKANGPFSGDASTLLWTFGNQSTPSSSNIAVPPPVSFLDSGAYPISLRVQEYTCDFTHTDTVYVFPLPKVDFIANNQGCSPLTVDFTNTSDYWLPLDYFWDFGNGATDTLMHTQYTYPTPGQYFVTLVAKSDSGCIGDFLNNPLFQIDVHDQPIADFKVSPDTTDLFANEFTVTNLSNDQQINYYLNGVLIGSVQNFVFDVADFGSYELMAIYENQFGCTDTMIKMLWVNPGTFYIPNTFTPNGDGLNEVFKPVVSNLLEYELVIYDRWGKVIFESDQFKNGWDGFFIGTNNPVPQGVYPYQLYYQSPDNISKTLYGSVNLIR
ncbi:MAG: gliding motility-associated-like protein [Flavobacteriales bacterium]